jgi:hypothetical protein
MDSALGLTQAQTRALIAESQEADVVNDITSVQIIAHRTKAIDAYDELGNHTGPSLDGTFIQEAIPGSAYFSDLEMSTMALEGGRTYVVTITPTGTGPVDITLVRSTATETLTSRVYLGIDATAQARITLTGDPYVADTWQLDVTGTGEDVRPVAPTTVFAPETDMDTIPPEPATIELEGVLGPQGWYISPVTVTLRATDNETGTGISRIEYAFSNDQQMHTYSGPFVVHPDDVGVLYAVAFDGAGNSQTSLSQSRVGPGQTRSFTTGIRDNFNRQNGPLKNNWYGEARLTGYHVVNKQLDIGSGGPIYWKAGAFGPTLEAYMTFVRVDPDGGEQALLLKVLGEGDDPDYRKGAIKVVYDAVAQQVRVETIEPGQSDWTVRGTFTATVHDADQLGARACVDGRVEVFHNGLLIGEADAGSFFVDKRGRIGLWFHEASDAVIDDFGGGTARR